MEEIEETILLMKKRLDDGQGTWADSMCRLSLPMALDLLRKLKAALEKNKEQEPEEKVIISGTDGAYWEDIGYWNW